MGIIMGGAAASPVGVVALVVVAFAMSGLWATPTWGASAYYPHAPIFVGCDEYSCKGFTPDNGVTGGNGTAANPFIIEGWDIQGGYLAGITISDTQAYFIIRNVYVHGAGEGVLLDGAPHGRIEGSLVVGNADGISIRSSPGVGVAGNVLRGNNFGMLSGDAVIISGNTIAANKGEGLVLSGANVTVTGNTFQGNGIAVIGTSAAAASHTIADNVNDGKPILYYRNCQGVSLEGIPVGEVIAVNCTGLTLRGLTITNTTTALQLLYVDRAIVEGNRLSSQAIGIWVSDSRNVTLRNNEVTSGGVDYFAGIVARSTVGLVVEGNTISRRHEALNLEVDGAFVRNNLVSGNEWGVSVRGSGSTLVSNTIGGNGYADLYIFEGINNRIFHNNFTSGRVLDSVTATVPGVANHWDAGYPGGGNYWRTYAGVDICSGPAQDACTGGDGIGDTPQPFDYSKRDHYPLMSPHVPTSLVPEASFSFSPAAPAVGETVTFNATPSRDPDGAPLAYYWAWGDGLEDYAATSPMASHRYLVRGTYDATLFVADATREVGVATRRIAVGLQPAPPVACFTSYVDAPRTIVAFDATCSYDPDGTIVAYAWAFGDGGTGEGPRVSHTYAKGGTYGVTLRVTDDSGRMGNISQDVIVSSDQAPVALFTYSPTAPEVGQIVRYDASASHDPDGTIVEYQWDFGDGGTATTAIVEHAYSSPGSYTVTLRVVDDGSQVGQTSQVLQVRPPPPPPAPWVELSGDFDYLLKEPIPIHVLAVVKDPITGEHLSGANVSITVYDPAGSPWISAPMVEAPSATGFYHWTSPGTIKELGLKKGTYTVRVQASYRGSASTFEGLLLHIDPPADEDAQAGEGLRAWVSADPYVLLLAVATAGVLIARSFSRRRIRR